MGSKLKEDAGASQPDANLDYSDLHLVTYSGFAGRKKVKARFMCLDNQLPTSEYLSKKIQRLPAGAITTHHAFETACRGKIFRCTTA
jgi:hypothetical protein